MMKFLFSLTLVSGLAFAQTPSPESVKFFSNTEAQASGGLANTLLTMSIASMGTTLVTTCLPQAGTTLPNSVVIFATASDNYARAEVVAANAHRLNLQARLAAVGLQAGVSKIRGGGDTQRKAIEEALIEQQALLDYITMKIGWLSAAIVGFNNSGNAAINEQNDGITPEDLVNCQGVFPASVPVSQAFISAYEVFEIQNKITVFLPGVLPIAVSDLLPLVASPDKRLILANIAVTAANNVIVELQVAAQNIQNNIINTQKVLAQFDLEEGVSLTAGVDATVPNPGTPAVDFVPAASVTVAAAAAGTYTPVIGSGSAAAPRRSFPHGACLSPPDMSKTTKEEICKDPVVFNEALVQSKNATLKSASDASMKFSSALASGNVNAAKLAAASLSALAGRVESEKMGSMKAMNADRLKKGQPMVDMDAETKKSLSKVISNISQEIVKAGGAKLLASSAVVPMPAAAPEVHAVQEVIPEETGPQRTTRLSAPKYVPGSEMQGSPGAAASGSSEDTSTLWEKLSHRYRAKFFPD